MVDRISAAVLYVHDFIFDYTSSPANVITLKTYLESLHLNHVLLPETSNCLPWKNWKLCITKSLLNKIWKDHVPNVFTQDVRLCPSCSPSSTPAFRWEMMSDIVHFLSINFQSCGNETFLCGDIEVNTYFDIQFDVTYEKILPWWVSKLRNVGKIPQQLSHIL